MKATTNSHPKKSPSSKAQRKTPERGCVRGTSRSPLPRRSASELSAHSRRLAHAAARRSDTAALRQEFRAWRASLPTQLERDTMLTPEWVAECVVQEVELFLQANLPENFAARLAAKAYHLYPRHRHFHKSLNRPGNRGRENLLMYMRHWTAGWLRQERNPLHKKLPYSFGMGRRLPLNGS